MPTEQVKSTTHTNDWTDEEERAVLWKLDTRLVPFLAVLYLLSFLDRANIGNARIAGLEEDANLSSSEFNWIISIFFVGYCTFEIPSNLMLRIVPPAKWISFIMVTWGFVLMGMAFCKSFWSLFFMRLLLGAAEAGLFPGIVYLTGSWWKKEEVATRAALYYGGASFAGAFGGLLAFAISFLSGAFGLRGWQWIFLLEGLPTVVVAVIVWFYFPNNPASATFLTEREQYIALARLRKQGHYFNTESQSDRRQSIKSSFFDWRVYLFMIIYMCGSTGMYSVSFFLPTIVRELGFSRSLSQLMVVPIYFAATITSVCASLHSDFKKERALHLIIPNFISISGFLMMVYFRSLWWRYFAALVTTMGVFCKTPVIIAWNNSNFAAETRRATSIGMMISFGNIGGFLGGQLYRSDDAPYYTRGSIINATVISIGAMLTMVMKLYYFEENQRRKNMTEDEKEQEIEQKGGRPELLGDRDPHFTYWL